MIASRPTPASALIAASVVTGPPPQPRRSIARRGTCRRLIATTLPRPEPARVAAGGCASSGLGLTDRRSGPDLRRLRAIVFGSGTACSIRCSDPTDDLTSTCPRAPHVSRSPRRGERARWRAPRPGRSQGHGGPRAGPRLAQEGGARGALPRGPGALPEARGLGTRPPSLGLGHLLDGAQSRHGAPPRAWPIEGKPTDLGTRRADTRMGAHGRQAMRSTNRVDP